MRLFFTHIQFLAQIQRFTQILRLSCVALCCWLGLSLPLGLPAQAATASEPMTRPVADLFEINCAGCHPQGGNIIRRSKTLKLKALSKNGYDTPTTLTEIISHGKGNMSAYQDRLSEAEIAQLADYVLAQAQQDWPH
jgi:cytochrome c6